MRRVTFGVACSLDHYIARPDHGVDWLLWNDEVAALSASYWETIDTVVMGRKTYEVAVRSGTPVYPGVKNIVFSRTMDRAAHEDIQIVAGDPGPFMADLKAQKGAGICVMGGGELANALFEANLIDEVGLNLHPLLLGQGIPLFHRMTKTIELKLLETQVLKTGCVYLKFRVIS